MVVKRLAGKLRVPGRTAAFVGTTFGMYGLLEAQTALTHEGRRADVLAAWVGRYGRAMLRVYGVDVAGGGPFVGEGKRHPGADARGVGRVFVMNHRSGLDIPLCLALFDATIVSRADLAGWPVIGMAARRVGTLFVDRASKQSGASVVVAMVKALEAGRGVMVYPEGTTYAGDEVRPFKPGAFHAARRAGAEIVPVGVAYAGEGASFGDEPFLDHLKRVSATARTRVAVRVGAPIAAGTRDVGELEGLARDAVQALVREARASL